MHIGTIWQCSHKLFFAWGSSDSLPTLKLPRLVIHHLRSLTRFTPNLLSRTAFLNIMTFPPPPHHAVCSCVYLKVRLQTEAKTLLEDLYHINQASVHAGLNWVEGTLKNWVTPLLIQLELSRWVTLFINSLQSLKSISYNMSNGVIKNKLWSHVLMNHLTSVVNYS